MEKKELFKAITDKMLETFIAKNADYGNSFEIVCDEEGLGAVRVRLADKFLRFKQLSKHEAKVKDEGIRDTLLDMANYCIMTVMWMDAQDAKPSEDMVFGDKRINGIVTKDFYPISIEDGTWCMVINRDDNNLSVRAKTINVIDSDYKTINNWLGDLSNKYCRKYNYKPEYPTVLQLEDLVAYYKDYKFENVE